MQWHSSTFLVLGGLLAGAGCGDDNHAPVTRDLDAGRSLQGGADTRSGRYDGGAYPDGAGPNTPPWLASVDAAACAVEPLSSIGALCGTADPTEPNSKRSPARLELGSTCNVVRAWAADKDEDAYQFSVTRADPVRIELSYDVSDRAELRAIVRDGSERELAHTSDSQAASVRYEQTVFQGTAGQSYEVSIEGSLLGTCLPYALRVDPSFCTDAFEDNDSEATASKLTHDATAGSLQPIVVQATASEGDMDFFQFSTPKADPVRVFGAYTAPANATVQLRRIVMNTAGLGSIDVAGARTGTRESFSHWLVSNSAGAVFRAQVWPTGTGCATYELDFDVAACTDDYEDNDLAAAAARIPFGQAVQATSFRADDDYYNLSGSAAGGTCTATYTLADDGPQVLRLVVYNGSAGTIANSVNPSGSSGTKSVSVKWDRPATVLAVSASNSGICQPYTLRCDAATPPLKQ